MMPVFLIAWAVGAWLVIMCTALVWAERIRIYLRLPVCDNSRTVVLSELACACALRLEG